MKIITAPDQRLRVKTKPVKKVTPDVVKIAREMIKFAKSFTDPEGVGLSTNQIGREERFFVGKLGQKFIVCFNPKILSASNKKRVFFEGCLSIPNYFGEVKRPVFIMASYENDKGKTVTRKFIGVSSWIFQHEVDHLNGILFMDHVLEQKGRVFKMVGKDRAGADVFEEVNINF